MPEELKFDGLMPKVREEIPESQDDLQKNAASAWPYFESYAIKKGSKKLKKKNKKLKKKNKKLRKKLKQLKKLTEENSIMKRNNASWEQRVEVIESFLRYFCLHQIIDCDSSTERKQLALTASRELGGSYDS